MKKYKSTLNKSLLDDKQLLHLFLNIVAKEPKPKSMSKSLYLTYLALQAFEQIGNKFPTQMEIDVMENAFRRYSRRKIGINLKVMTAA